MNMRKLLITLAFCPCVAVAQSNDPIWNQYQAIMDAQQNKHDNQAVVPVQPIIPVPQDRGPWGTGYSIVTTTRPTRQWYDRDVTGSETVQRVVPNDALGQPMKGLDLNNW